MRYFGGLTDQEVAESLDLTTRTVQTRLGRKARLLLGTMLKDAG